MVDSSRFILICRINLLLTLLFTFFAFDMQAQEKKDTLDKNDGKLSYQKILKEGSLDTGVLNVLRLKKDIYLEIPDSLLARDFLIVNKISSVPFALNGHGLNKGMAFETKMIRFYKDTLLEKVWVKTINPRVQSPIGDDITLSVRDNFGESVIEVFDIETKNQDSTSVLIKVNRIFNGKEKSFCDLLGNTGLGGSLKSNLSKIEEVKSFPENVFVKSLLSTSVTEANTPAMPLSVGVSTNIVLLPEDVMKPRFSDDRIGYFTTPMDYYNDEQHGVEHRDLITRWRLEPKVEDIERYKKGILVEPKKPIVYYLDPSTPKKWKKYIEKGVYDWNSAFAQAGFKNALVVKEVSSDDKDFDADDVRYSVVTYAASANQNAMGPSVVDPRSGEIIESDIIWWHNLMRGLHSWLRIQTSSISSESRKNKFSDEHMGEAIRFVSSHEVGHTFGLKHNMGASHSYPVDSLRSRHFTSNMSGTAPSIMDYARYNYIAQPEDDIVDIRPKIGVYDRHAINWGYRWIDAETPAEELPILNQWLRKHENDPLYFYGPQQPSGNIVDPRSQSEDLGDDAVKASEYGLKNLKRIMPHIIEWTEEEGHDYYKAGKLLKDVIAQWDLYNNHVMANIGGLYTNNTIYGDGKETFVPVPSDIQEGSLEYLIRNAIRPQKWLFLPKSISKIFPIRDAPDGDRHYSPVSVMRMYQNTTLYNLIKTDRLMRIVENKVLYKKGEKVFTEELLFNTLYESIFRKTMKSKDLDMFDRMTQNNYVDALILHRKKLLKKHTSKSLSDRYFKNIHFDYVPRVSDVGAIRRGELVRILELLKKKKRKGDTATKRHYGELISRIEYSLHK